MVHKLISAAFVASLLCTAAMADDQDKDTKMQSADATFKSLDRNSDERLSQAETASDPTLSQQFSMLDSDSDGYLTKREFAAHEKQEKRNKHY
jgi:Ca2+-binding EF-hand superfamily protein